MTRKRLYIFTIVLDGMPFLPMQLSILNRLTCDWRWIIVEGAAANKNCTSWCKPQPPRFSTDGSHEFIYSLMNHPRVMTIGQRWWDGGKVEMCNRALAIINEPCALLQMDVDELWLPSVLSGLPYLVETNFYDTFAFRCRYFLGPNIITLGDNAYGNRAGEWVRLWDFKPGMRFQKHEPPVMLDAQGNLLNNGVMGPEATFKRMGISFDHWAYMFQSQVAYKEQFYGYSCAVENWKRLQAHNGPWPVRLKEFLPWVDDGAQAGLLYTKPII